MYNSIFIFMRDISTQLDSTLNETISAMGSLVHYRKTQGHDTTEGRRAVTREKGAACKTIALFGCSD